jgi:hypothetical protein
MPWAHLQGPGRALHDTDADVLLARCLASTEQSADLGGTLAPSAPPSPPAWPPSPAAPSALVYPRSAGRASPVLNRTSIDTDRAIFGLRRPSHRHQFWHLDLRRGSRKVAASRQDILKTDQNRGKPCPCNHLAKPPTGRSADLSRARALLPPETPQLSKQGRPENAEVAPGLSCGLIRLRPRPFAAIRPRRCRA